MHVTERLGAGAQPFEYRFHPPGSLAQKEFIAADVRYAAFFVGSVPTIQCLEEFQK